MGRGGAEDHSEDAVVEGERGAKGERWVLGDLVVDC